MAKQAVSQPIHAKDLQLRCPKCGAVEWASMAGWERSKDTSAHPKCASCWPKKLMQPAK